ncbi:MAG: bifunctional diaminohydroxyphosphoribosylaminopyrimidine deaminase/5-amino-6-(5-phosphoribosylamino)uracil reductase RibD [Coriobacteriia bacterium]|nr:bifunctional diaminohydroxyphosphoribosylaminopyrimidine deaminase/5-amino-6-(5-phosphoribosylamino)uracil reductase RibD [Coriobacteriia bacterium]
MRLFSDDSTLIADPFLRRAWTLAQRGLGTTSPNPMVGCVVVRDSRVIGEGWHERVGGPHAEAVALVQAGPSACDATAYVTLEPCAHHGRTPPCTDALVKAGVARVVIGMPDPSEVASGGAERLRAAGIDVSFAEDPAPYEALNLGWLTLVRKERPWVTVKIASSLDGKLSAGPGLRTRISGPGSRPVTMRLRAASDAVLVGARTALVDDPRLTVRDEASADAVRQPLRVVMTRTTDPGTCSLFSDGSGPAVLLVPVGSGMGAPPGAEILEYSADDGLRGALRVLGARGIARLLVEAGPDLFTALWDENLIDELVVIHAGSAAGADAVGMYAGATTGTDDALGERMTAFEAAVAGCDAITVWRRAI